MRAPPALRSLLLAAVVPPQALPFKSFGPREGLPHESVAALLEDSRGFLWVGTWDGLARFDGASFTTHGSADGRTSTVSFALAEDPRGDLWYSAQPAGIARLPCASRPASGERVEFFPVGDSPDANSIEAIVFLGERAWVASSDGLRAMTVGADGRPRFELRWSSRGRWAVQGVARQGTQAWILSASACVALAGDDATPFPGPGAEPGFDVRAAPAADGRALVSTGAGLYEFTPPARFEPFSFDVPHGGRVKATAIDPDGTRWIGTTRGLFHARTEGVERLGRAAGLPSESISTLLIDRAGHPWVGTFDGGVAVLAAPSPVSLLWNGERTRISRLARGADGRLIAAGNGLFSVGEQGLALLPGSTDPPIERTDGFVHGDGTGALWIGTAGGLYRCDAPERDALRVAGPLVPGPCAGPVTGDARGRLWVSAAPHTVYVRAPEGGFEPELEWPASDDNVREVLVDREERLWLVAWRGLWRRDGNELREIRLAGEPPQARAVLHDRRGWLWLGLRHGGLAWTREPGADVPFFERLHSADGLPSDTVWSLCEGPAGELWIGTGRGLARLDPDAAPGSALDTWTIHDGLAGGSVFHVLVGSPGTELEFAL